MLKGDEAKYSTALQKLNTGLNTINNFIINVQTTYRTIESELNRLKIDKPQEFLSIQNIISENTTTLTSRKLNLMMNSNTLRFLNNYIQMRE